jgi:hypothetical protein
MRLASPEEHRHGMQHTLTRSKAPRNEEESMPNFSLGLRREGFLSRLSTEPGALGRAAGYYDNYLVDNPSCVIVGAQATAARMSQ